MYDELDRKEQFLRDIGGSLSHILNQAKEHSTCAYIQLALLSLILWRVW